MNRAWRFAVPFIGTFAAGSVGMLFVNGGVAAWYQSLQKPPLTPPDWLFPIVWTILYILMAYACALAWTRDKQDAHTEGWVRYYFVHLLFNMGWTIFFFGFHEYTLSLFVILVLLFFVVTLTASGWALDRRVTYLMLPYAAWVLFATYLMCGLWLLN